MRHNLKSGLVKCKQSEWNWMVKLRCVHFNFACNLGLGKLEVALLEMAPSRVFLEIYALSRVDVWKINVEYLTTPYEILYTFILINY